MRNPFRSEDAAFRFVGLTIGYFALIVGGAAINRWLGLGVFVAETAAVAWWFARHRDAEGVDQEAPWWRSRSLRGHESRERRLLVVANETVAGSELLAELRRQTADRNTLVMIVCPALNSPLRHWVSDEDAARASAGERLTESLDTIRALGINATGEVGDGDPIQAMEDALRTFEPDEIVISTHPEGKSNWLERDVVSVARTRFGLPVTHVVVDLDAGRQATLGGSGSERPV
jgi:hypothetical protein